MRYISVLLVMMLTACRPVPTAVPTITPTPISSLDGTKWLLTSIARRPLLDGTQITLAFYIGDHAGGEYMCGQYGGTYLDDGGVLTIYDVAEIGEGCDPAYEAQDGKYIDVFTTVNRYERSGETLTLFGADARLIYTLISGE